MKKRVLIAGASGMVGKRILDKCLASPQVSNVVSLVRKESTITHPKLQEVLVADFKDYTSLIDYFERIDAAFFRIGAYAGQVSKSLFKEITVDYAVRFAAVLKDKSPDASMCLLSGSGADRTEQSGMALAKYKGIAENGISRLGLQFYAFRPGYIYPVTPRKEPSIMYRLLRWFYPILKRLSPDSSITSEQLAQAMFNIGLHGANEEILENSAILGYANSVSTKEVQHSMNLNL
ncbi:MAG: NAD-dependent epimerase/dehydratase family protein [Cyclobacteriaceae bacterium]